jgi:hypothetical protein
VFIQPPSNIVGDARVQHRFILIRNDVHQVIMSA